MFAPRLLIRVRAAQKTLQLTALVFLLGASPLARAQAPFTTDVAYTIWTGSENLGGFNRLTFEFNGNGAVIMIDALGRLAGSYSQEDGQVTIRFGDCEYNGTINGENMYGTARFFTGNRSGQTWSWSVTRR